MQDFSVPLILILRNLFSLLFLFCSQYVLELAISRDIQALLLEGIDTDGSLVTIC